MTYRSHWDPWTAYDDEGYEHRLQHRDDEPHPRFGYRDARIEVDEFYDGPDEPDNDPGWATW